MSKIIINVVYKYMPQYDLCTPCLIICILATYMYYQFLPVYKHVYSASQSVTDPIKFMQ